MSRVADTFTGSKTTKTQTEWDLTLHYMQNSYQNQY